LGDIGVRERRLVLTAGFFVISHCERGKGKRAEIMRL
jgi:hypothetical protein